MAHLVDRKKRLIELIEDELDEVEEYSYNDFYSMVDTLKDYMKRLKKEMKYD